MLNLIVAPKAHNQSAEGRAKKVVKYLKSEQVEYSVYFSQSFDQVKENVKHLLSFGESEFVIVGDEAVVSCVLSCFKDLHKIRIGIIPTSSKDDFASYLGISSNPTHAIKEILKKQVENIDIMIVNDMAVLNSIVIGASVDILNKFNQFKIRNFISEKYATLKYGNKFPGIELTLENKGKAKRENVFELYVANGGFSKGKIISPLSNLKDGVFNVNYRTVSDKPSKKKFLNMVNKGNHIYDEETKQHWMNNLKITTPDKKIRAIIDGRIHNVEELNISIIESGLKIYK